MNICNIYIYIHEFRKALNMSEIFWPNMYMFFKLLILYYIDKYKTLLSNYKINFRKTN